MTIGCVAGVCPQTHPTIKKKGTNFKGFILAERPNDPRRRMAQLLPQQEV
jgi:hypothetical protein